MTRACQPRSDRPSGGGMAQCRHQDARPARAPTGVGRVASADGCRRAAPRAAARPPVPAGADGRPGRGRQEPRQTPRLVQSVALRRGSTSRSAISTASAVRSPSSSTWTARSGARAARASAASSRRVLASPAATEALVHALDEKTSEARADSGARRRRAGLEELAEQDVGERPASRWSTTRSSSSGSSAARSRVQLLGRAEAGVQVLGHALELLRQRGDFLLASGQAAADGRREERRQGGCALHQAREAFRRQAPDDALGQRGEGCGARLVAQQGQVAEHGRRLEDVQPTPSASARPGPRAGCTVRRRGRPGRRYLVRLECTSSSAAARRARSTGDSSENGGTAANLAAALLMAWRAPEGLPQ